MSRDNPPIPPRDDVPDYMTEERLMIQETARNFTMKEVLPVANELDPINGEIPMSLRDQMARMGFFGIMIPTRYEGLGLGCFEYCLVAEELARGWMSVASIMARGNAAGSGFNEQQKADFMPRIPGCVRAFGAECRLRCGQSLHPGATRWRSLGD